MSGKKWRFEYSANEQSVVTSTAKLHELQLQLKQEGRTVLQDVRLLSLRQQKPHARPHDRDHRQTISISTLTLNLSAQSPLLCVS